MKLLYVLGSFYPAQNGGPNNSTYWAAKQLVRQGMDVTVASLKCGLETTHLDNHGLALNRMNQLDGVEAWYFDYGASRYLSISMFRWLFINIRKYDMVNLSSVFFPWTWISAILCLFFRIPFSIAPRGELEPGALYYKKALKIFVNHLFVKRLMAKACFVLVTSQQEEHFSRAYFPKGMPFETVPNFISLDDQAPSLEYIKQKRDILYIGRLHKKKGIENLIHAFGLVNKDLLGKNRLLIVGNGNKDYLNSLRKLSEKSSRSNTILFLGHRAGYEKEKIYKNAKVLVLPSYSENFGNVVLEALAYATPVIASKFTPWSELDKAGCGRWVENNPEALAVALESVLSLVHKKYLKMALSARDFVTKHYDVRQNGKNLERIYRGYLD